MKQLLLTVLLAASASIGSFAQKASNLVIFTEEPKPFYAIVNGIKQNVAPQTNVKITGLTNPNASIKVVFQDGSDDLNKTIWYESMGKEVTMRIVKTKKGYKLRYFGEVPIESAAENTDQTVIVYHTEEVKPEPQPTTQTVTVTEQTTTTTNTNSTPAASTPNTTQESENVSIGMNLGGFGVNMNVNINESGTAGTSTNSSSSNVEYSSSTTTTTTTTTNSSTGFDFGANENESIETTPTPVVYVTGYNGPIGCPIPESSISSIKSSVEDESFSDDRMNVAKQALKNRCITVSQVRDILSVFDFEDKKLEFAKYAYDRTYDIGNYYLINKDFDFSSTKDKLNNFINSK